MVIFMLNNTSPYSIPFFFMGIKIFILILNFDFCWAFHIFSNSGQAQTSFIKKFRFAIKLQNLRIDQYFFEVLNRFVVFFKWGSINNYKANTFINLRSSKANALCFI